MVQKPRGPLQSYRAWHVDRWCSISPSAAAYLLVFVRSGRGHLLPNSILKEAAAALTKTVLCRLGSKIKRESFLRVRHIYRLRRLKFGRSRCGGRWRRGDCVIVMSEKKTEMQQCSTAKLSQSHGEWHTAGCGGDGRCCLRNIQFF